MPLGAMREAMRLLREYNTSLFPIPLSCPVHRNRKLNGHRETLDRFIDSHIKSRRANGQPDKPDFLSVLMSAEDPDSGELLSRQALIDETKTLFIAGFETTAGVMAWALYLFWLRIPSALRFPQYLGEISRLLEGASRVSILADCSDYGSFFAPEDHESLHDAFCHFSRRSGHKLQILVAGPPSASPGAFGQFYENLLGKGMKPELARLTLARKIAAITLHVWKKGEPFDAQ